MYCMVYIVYHSPPDTCCSDVRFSSDRISSIFIFTQTYIYRPSSNFFSSHVIGLIKSDVILIL